MSKPSRLSVIYSGIKQRCCNPKCRNYMNYGGRGISICAEWLDSEKISFGKHSHNITKGFLSFKEWSLKNGYSDNLSLDRIDNDKDYCPENCRWTTSKTQNNNKRNNIVVAYNGRKQTLKQWCDELELCYDKIFQRIIVKHWSAEKAFEYENDARSKLICYKGVAKPLSVWCKEFKLNYRTINSRLNKLHWSIERAFEYK